MPLVIQVKRMLCDVGWDVGYTDPSRRVARIKQGGLRATAKECKCQIQSKHNRVFEISPSLICAQEIACANRKPAYGSGTWRPPPHNSAYTLLHSGTLQDVSQPPGLSLLKSGERAEALPVTDYTLASLRKSRRRVYRSPFPRLLRHKKDPSPT